VQAFPPFREKQQSDFVFMNNDVSSERRVELLGAQVAQALLAIRERRGRTVAVVGPVVVHTGASEHLCALVRGGYIQAILSGNALGVHDVEAALLGTSLGVDIRTGMARTEGHSNHMHAINVVRRCGSLRAAVESGVLTRGVMYECIRAGPRP
jgi:hypothetical protein